MEYYVAKSYQELERVTEPYEVNGKMYVKVRKHNGNIQQVRAYTESEYTKLYGRTCANPVLQATQASPSAPVVKDILGFADGYIWIFKGDLDRADYWFERTPAARFHCQLGWYIVSTDTLPSDIPSCIQAIKLPWEEIGNVNGTLKTKEEIQNILSIVRADKTSKSLFQGQIGQRLEVSVYVDKIIDLEANQYGRVSYLHFFVDEAENVYVWNTASRRLNEKDFIRIRGTVKEHKVFKGVQQTIFTRCSIL